MGNRESGESSRWVQASVDVLAPPADWEPDVRLARARLAVRADARARRRVRVRRRLLAGAAAALAISVAVPAIPQTHDLAQQAANNAWQRLEQAWYWLTVVRRGPVLARNFEHAVRALHTRQADSPGAMPDAGFAPRLPQAGTLSRPPQVTVSGPLTFAATLSAADAPIPPQWDGVRITMQTGPVATAHWADVSDGKTEWSDLTLTQVRATVTAPPGFDLTEFARVVLTATGMRNPDTVRQLAAQPTTLPALLYGYRADGLLGVRDLPLRSGFMTMIEELGPSGPDMPSVERLTLLWSGADRMYVLSGVPKTPPRMLSGDLAVVLSGAIAVAYATDPPTGHAGPHRILYRVPPGNR
jgi:hypothetical protein